MEKTGIKFEADSFQVAALKTWYAVDNPLHLDPRHPLIKLAGEAGEILDLYGKHEYKPGFDWWDCDHCRKSRNGHMDGAKCYHDRDATYTPKVLDELGDYWYYLRILAYQQGVVLRPGNVWDEDILYLLCGLSSYSTGLLEGFVHHKEILKNFLQVCFDVLVGILCKLNCTLDHLTDLNYRKLNSEPTAHGWKR